MKRTGAVIVVSRGAKVSRAALTACPYRWAGSPPKSALAMAPKYQRQDLLYRLHHGHNWNGNRLDAPDVIPNPSPFGNPGCIVSTWRTIETWLTQNAPKLLQGLAPGANARELADAETRLAQFGLTLPPSVKASYAIHNGGSHFLPDWDNMYSIHEAIQIGPMFNFMSKCKPYGKDWFIPNPNWIPLTSINNLEEDGALFLDLDPASGSNLGQLICWPDRWAQDYVVAAPSFESWLDGYAHDLAAGYYVFHDGFVMSIEEQAERETQKAAVDIRSTIPWQEWAERGEKQTAIMCFREETGAGLAEAKQAVEKWIAENCV